MVAEFSILWPLVGGLIIGVSVTLLLLFNGRITGISGIVFSVLSALTEFRFRFSEQLWRILFIIGLVVGTVLFHFISGMAPPEATVVPLPLVIVGGLLVGFGTKLGSGCTSGHGICGIARLSPRSIASTLVFITAGIVSVYVFRHILGWS